MQLKLLPENEILKPKTKEQLGLSIYNKIKHLLTNDPYDILKIKKRISLKSKTEQKNNEIIKMLNLVEKGKDKVDSYGKELDSKRIENEKLIVVLRTEMGI